MASRSSVSIVLFLVLSLPRLATAQKASVQFAQPGNLTFDPGTFGQSTTAVRQPDLTTRARQIQFGMKLSF